MEPHTSMKAAAILFSVTALGGIAMALMRFRGTPRPPSWIVVVHGLLAASGLIVLIYAALTVGLPIMGSVALGLFILAALGGASINFFFHSKKLPLPISMIIGHALIATTGLILLLISILKN